MFAYLCVLVLAYTSFTYAQNAAGITPLTIADSNFEADPPTCQGNLTDFLGGSLNCAYTFGGSDDTCANQLGSTECFLPVDFNQAYPFNNTGLAAGEFSWANNGNANNAGLTSLGNVTGLETDATAVTSFGEIAGYVLPGGSLDTELLGEVDQRIDYTFTLDYCSTTNVTATVGTFSLTVYLADPLDDQIGASTVTASTVSAGNETALQTFDLSEGRVETVEIDNTDNTTGICGTIEVTLNHYELFGAIGEQTFAVRASYAGSGAVLFDNLAFTTVDRSAVCTPVFISEIDHLVAGEEQFPPIQNTQAIEITGPAGFNMSGYKLYLLDGNNTEDTGDVFAYAGGEFTDTYLIPDNGSPASNSGHFTMRFLPEVQDGEFLDTDGIILVDDTDTVVQFICYGNGTDEGDLMSGRTVAFNGTALPTVVLPPCSFTLNPDDVLVVDGVDVSLQLRGCGQCLEDFDWHIAPQTHNSDGQHDGPIEGAENAAMNMCTDVDGDGYWAGQTFYAFAGEVRNLASGVANAASQCCNGNDCQNGEPTIYPQFNTTDNVICDGYLTTCNIDVEVRDRSEEDQDGDGRIPCDGDCNDDLANGGLQQYGEAENVTGNVYYEEGAANSPDNGTALPEICDGLDNNCNFITDELWEHVVHYPDLDGDYYGASGLNQGASSETIVLANCTFPEGFTNSSRTYPIGWAPTNDDCDDSNENVNPGEPIDLCDTLDNDCDGDIDEDIIDNDEDGFGVDQDGVPATGENRQCDTATVGPANSTIIDCDDNNNVTYPGAPESCDGFDNNCNATDDAATREDLDIDGDLYVACTFNATIIEPTLLGDDDCNDTLAFVFPNNTEVCDGYDNDCSESNGGLTSETNETDSDGDGYIPCLPFVDQLASDQFIGGGDCNDSDSTINPGATGTDLVDDCDGLDNDCDGEIDEDNVVDADNDLFASVYCSTSNDTRANNVEGQADCDDTRNFVFPGATDVCDGFDNDCNNATVSGDEDFDGDTYLNCTGTFVPRGDARFAGNGDCAPEDPEINPAESDFANSQLAGGCDGIDNDCDDLIDNDGDGTTYDRDGDDFADPNEFCATSSLDVADGDCNDQEPTIFPNATELCNGIDDDCDGEVPLNEQDEDGDGFAACEGDCEPENPAINPGAADLYSFCDGVDNDCDGQTDEEGIIDADNDGFAAEYCSSSSISKEPDADCDDNNANANPDSVEQGQTVVSGCGSNGDCVDNDCNGSVDDDIPNIRLSVSKDCLAGSSSGDSASDAPTCDITITASNVGQGNSADASHVVIVGKILLPAHASIVDRVFGDSSFSVRISGNGELLWVQEAIDAGDAAVITVTINVREDSVARHLHATATLDAIDGYSNVNPVSASV